LSIEENLVNHPEFKMMTISRGLSLYAYVEDDNYNICAIRWKIDL